MQDVDPASAVLVIAAASLLHVFAGLVRVRAAVGKEAACALLLRYMLQLWST